MIKPRFVFRGTIGDITVHDTMTDDGVYGIIKTATVDEDLCIWVAGRMGYLEPVKVGKIIFRDYCDAI